MFLLHMLTTQLHMLVPTTNVHMCVTDAHAHEYHDTLQATDTPHHHRPATSSLTQTGSNERMLNFKHEVTSFPHTHVYDKQKY